MRLSGFAIAAFLLVSTSLLCQHSTGGGSSHSGSSGSSAGSFSTHSSFSGGSGASVSIHGSANSGSHIGGTTGSLSSGKGTASPEKKSAHSFFHPFRKAGPVENAGVKHPAPCLKGRPCPVCPAGGSHFGGACVPVSNGCQAGQSWNGFTCGVSYWPNGCESLADQLAAERRLAQGQSDFGQSLRLRLLQQQYDQCLMRFGYSPFSALLLDTP